MNIRWPLIVNVITRGRMATFGMVRDNDTKPHHGWDLYAHIGARCFAVDDGVVVHARFAGTYGRIVDIKLDSMWNGHAIYARYAHLSMFAASIKENERVSKNQLIGYTGSSGNAEGMTGIDMHLHFEFLKTFSPGQGAAGVNDRYDPAAIYGLTPMNAPIYDMRDTLREPNDGRTIPHRG